MWVGGTNARAAGSEQTPLTSPRPDGPVDLVLGQIGGQLTQNLTPGGAS